jgi:hypothetical protein
LLQTVKALEVNSQIREAMKNSLRQKKLKLGSDEAFNADKEIE